MDWFLYDRDLHHEKVNKESHLTQLQIYLSMYDALVDTKR